MALGRAAILGAMIDEMHSVSLDAPRQTRRLVLRPLEDRDVAALISYRSLPEVCRWVPFEPMDAAAVGARLSGQWRRHSLEKEGDAVVLGIVIGATGELIGDTMVHWASEQHGVAEIGYVLHPAHEGHGFATEAAHELLHIAFDDLKAHRVTARTDLRNLASTRVLARLKMRQEAHLVDGEWFKGAWSDVLDFALLDREWAAGHPARCP